MARNERPGWERRALVTALGRRPDEDVKQPDPNAPGINLHVMRWRCDDGAGLVSAVKAPYDDGYTVETSCRHPQHVEIARLPYVRIEHASLIDGKGAPTDLVPGNLKGGRLRFRLNSPVRGFARIEVDADMNAPGMIARRRIEVECGTFGPGPHVFDADLDPEGELDGPVRQEVTISIHVLDPKTAMRDPGADGIRLWRGTYGVQRANVNV
jgi:hypothetical protein